MLANVSSHTHRFEQGEACDDGHLERAHLSGEGLKQSGIKDGVRKKEIHAQANLFFHIVKVEPCLKVPTWI